MRSTRSVPLSLVGDSGIRRIVKRNLSAILGLGLLALAAAIAASLASWTADDPSLSHATDHAARNVLGLPGALVSDLIMQFFGLAGMILLLPPVVWAWRLVFAQPTRFSWRTALTWLLGLLATALTLAMFSVPHGWALPIGLGGVAGDLLLKLTGVVFGVEPAGVRAVVFFLLLMILAFFLVLHACGLSFRRIALTDAVAKRPKVPAVRPTERAIIEADEEEDPDETLDEGDEEDDFGRFTLFLGALAHLTLRLVSGFHRLVRRGQTPFPRRTLPNAFAGGGAARAWGGPRLEPTIDGEDEDWSIADIDVEPAPARRKRRVTEPAPKPRAGRRTSRQAQGSLLAAEGFELPPLRLLAEPRGTDKRAAVNPDALEHNARRLEGVLDDFGVRGEIINVRPGPVVTLYELEPAPGIKSARVIGLADDIARSMSAIATRVAVIPGKNAIGIELPNAKRETVLLRELLASEDFEKTKARLALCLGRTIGGEPVIVDLARMPHLLVAGTTGSGKSVSINTMILSLLYRLTPEECRMIMIDPKMLELSTYDGIPHLMTPVVTDPKQAVIALKWTVREMEDRYRKMSKLGVRNIDGYNARLAQARDKGETLTRTVQTGFDRHTGQAIYEQEELSLEAMPYIVVIIDEMADLMMVAGKDIEGTVQRLAQMARAAGIHVVMATQRPSVDVITGTIKANFPTRISFQVASKIDSRTILNDQGAEQLLGQGDMLFMAGGGRIQRVHGPFVSDKEVEDVVAHLKAQGTPDYLESITVEEEPDGENFDQLAEGEEESNDLYDRAVAIVLRDRKASTSYIQRRLSIGYNRAASIIERMEKEDLVGPANHAGKRDILVGEEDEGGFR
jgi:S-DNA-T family DNA segregation ATPase FtsK/SpoIIIE